MIRVGHPAIKLASYTALAAFATAVGLWDVKAAAVTCAVAFAVDGLASSLLLGAKAVSPDSRWLVYAVPLCAIAAGRGFAATLGL